MSSDKKPSAEHDYSSTLFLPETSFPMRAGLPQKEPEILARWEREGLYRRLREASKGRDKFVLHDGPPYANGNIHIGHALNKILKDLVTRTHQMSGYDSNYVPGWDCHGLPIEWKIEEENYRSKNKPKPNFASVDELIAFRKECRAYAGHWLNVQREEFKRLGVEGDWAHPYTTMSFPAEAQIARELMKFALNGTLYRGSKPVMWSVVEKTALAEAEVEYEDYQSDTIWVKFPVAGDLQGFEDKEYLDREFSSEKGAVKTAEAAQASTVLKSYPHASIVIWTTTPWTIPGNRAISFSPRIAYGLYEVTQAPAENWAKPGDQFVLADKLAANVMAQARVDKYRRVATIPADSLQKAASAHPLKSLGYEFKVPLLAGDHVTDEDGTGFVHTAPGHGRDDFEIWMAHGKSLAERGIDARIPYTVNEDGFLTKEAPGFEGRRVIDDKGKKGDANDAVIKALADAGALIARSRLKHQYPHSWRSKKPIIFRNTPQWFIAMDKEIPAYKETLRALALLGIKNVKWVPAAGENRITGMIESRPDWVISRQRAWGVPIAVFIRQQDDGTTEVLKDEAVNKRIIEAFEQEGADAWYKQGARERFLGSHANESWQKVDDILDVWFDSGSTHAFVLEDPQNFPTLAGIRRKRDGGKDTVMYLEGSDQHRGWFHSSLLESCGTRGRPPYDVVLTHGFVLDEQGRKMSKSLGNVVAPQDVMKESGADILRMWVAASDYADDLRIGKEILKTTVDTYRKLRNTLRWLLGSLHHFKDADRVPFDRMPELERLMLHRLAELDGDIRKHYAEFDYKRVFAALNVFMTSDLSAFYFDIRKDALYCDPISSVTRRACLTALDEIFKCLATWLAPILCFTAEEAWLSRYGESAESVHLQSFPKIPGEWINTDLKEKWEKIRDVRRVVTGALELERVAKRIGSSLEAAPVIHVADKKLLAALKDVDLAEVCITSDATLKEGEGPKDAFRLPDVPFVSVEPKRAEGKKCARSWKISPAVGSDREFPDVTPRDAQALRELAAAKAS